MQTQCNISLLQLLATHNRPPKIGAHGRTKDWAVFRKTLACHLSALSVLPLFPPANFENFALTPIQLLFGLAFGSSSKDFDAQLTRVHVAKDGAQ